MPLTIGKQTSLWHSSGSAKVATASYVAGDEFRTGDKDKLWLTVALSGTAATLIHLDVQFSADASTWWSMPNLPNSGELAGGTATHVVPVSVVGRHYLRLRVKRTGGDTTTAVLVKGSHERSYGDLTGATVDSSGQVATLPNGGVASDAADSGNPIKVGAVYEATLTTVDDGDRTDLKADDSGRMLAVASGAVAADAADAGNPVKVGGVYNATPASVDDGDIVDVACDAAGRTLAVASGDVAADAADAGNPVKVGGVYNATDAAFDDGDRTDLQADIAGVLRTVAETKSAYELVADVTNGATDTTFAYYIDMEGYRELAITTANISTSPTDTATVTIEASAQDDGTAEGSCDYVDITQYGTVCTTAAAAASFVDQNVGFYIPTAGAYKYIKVQVVTSAGAGADADWTVHAIKHK